MLLGDQPLGEPGSEFPAARTVRAPPGTTPRGAELPRTAHRPTHQLVVQYVRDGDIVWVMPGQPDRKRWWRNLVKPLPVELWLAGEHLHGVARAINANEQPDKVAAALTAYCAVVPRTRSAGGSTVMVRIDIEHTLTAQSDVRLAVKKVARRRHRATQR